MVVIINSNDEDLYVAIIEILVGLSSLEELSLDFGSS